MNRILGILAIAIFTACGKTNTPYKTPHDEPLVDVPLNPPAPDDPQTPPPAETPTRYCKRNASGNFDTKIKIDAGGGTGNTFYWGQGGTCINRGLEAAWKLFQNQDALAWDGTDKHDILDQSEGSDGSLFFLDKYWVTTFFITVSWEMEWYHSIYSGTVDKPLAVLINYKKVRGTSHIPYWEGSIALERVTDSVTSFTMKNQIRADRTDLNDAKTTISDLLTRVLK